MADFEAQLERIGRKLDDIRRRAVSTFGSGSHQYRLGPCLSEAEVVAFEAEHGITLPPAYRAFIRRVGHGGIKKGDGAGPYYGLYGLGRWDDFMDWAVDGAPKGWLGRPCPLKEGRNELPEIDDDLPDGDWPGDDHLANFAGILTIGSRGCTYLTGLVVTGESRGRVVYLDVDYSEPPYVGRDANFLDWYERWLDELSAGREGLWFGYGPAGDETALLELATSEAPDDLRAEAVGNLWKLPSLTDATWSVLTHLVSDPDERVRAAVAQIFDRGLPRHADVIAPLLGDEAPRVRAVACRSVVHLSPAYVDSVWSLLLSEADPDVRHAAYHALLRENALSPQRLEILAESDDLGAVSEQAKRALARK